MNAMRIALLTHSTNPRGGVVHALELGDALTRLGHEAVVYAPDATGAGFFRGALCSVAPIPVAPFKGDVTDMVETRIADYLSHFERDSNRRFDVYHAQDGISGNALATLKRRGLISAFARTVHHIDAFSDERLSALQARSIAEADELFVVSEAWRDVLDRTFGRRATVVGNGVDRARFNPSPDGRDVDLRRRLALGGGPIFLSIGGIEERKNSIRILEAFAQVRSVRPESQLLIAGGASLLDHDAYRRRFAQRRDDIGLPKGAIVITGSIGHDDMPALYRLANALVFPSLKEGFGLVVLEAMSSDLPVVAARIAPFVEYLRDGDVAWCDPLNVATIANAMLVAATQPSRDRLARRGRLVAGRHEWANVAAAHIGVYAKMREPAHA
jgi:glycosyltransferase-like protein